MNHKEECSDFAERMTVTSLIIVSLNPCVCPIVSGASSTMITRSGTHSSSNHLILPLSPDALPHPLKSFSFIL